MDIDDTLIRAAWKRRRTVWSQQPVLQDSEQLRDGGKGRPTKRARMSEVRDVVKRASFPVAFEHMFGPLSILPAEPETTNAFPHNVSFRTADWVKDGALEDRGDYDVVLA